MVEFNRKSSTPIVVAVLLTVCWSRVVGAWLALSLVSEWLENDNNTMICKWS